MQIKAPPPQLTILDQSPTPRGRQVVFGLTSPRGAGRLDLYLPIAHLRRISANGFELPVKPSDTLEGFYHLACFGFQCSGLEVSLEINGQDLAPAYLSDSTFGLPPTDKELADTRPPDSIQAEWGDLTVIWNRLEF